MRGSSDAELVVEVALVNCQCRWGEWKAKTAFNPSEVQSL